MECRDAEERTGGGEESGAGAGLMDLEFINRFTADLPADQESTNERREVKGALFSRVAPTPTSAPVLVAASSECARLIGLNNAETKSCLLYTSPSPRDQRGSRMPSSA